MIGFTLLLFAAIGTIISMFANLGAFHRVKPALFVLIGIGIALVITYHLGI